LSNPSSRSKASFKRARGFLCGPAGINRISLDIKHDFSSKKAHYPGWHGKGINGVILNLLGCVRLPLIILNVGFVPNAEVMSENKLKNNFL